MKVELRQHPASQFVLGNMLSGPAIMFGALMASNAAAYLYHMIIARLLGPAEYGAVVVLLSLSYVLAVLMRTFQAWVITSVVALRERGEERLGSTFGLALGWLAPLGLLAFGLHWLLSPIVAGLFHLDTVAPVIALGIYTFTSFLVPIPRGLLIGIKRLHTVSLLYLLDPLARIAAGTALVLWMRDASGAVLAFSVGNAAVFIVGTAVLWPLIRGDGSGEGRGAGLQLRDHYAVVVLLINGCLALMAGLDQIAVKHFFAEEVAGNFAVAYLLGQMITMSTAALGWVIFAQSATRAPGYADGHRTLVRALLLIGAIGLTLTSAYVLAPTLAVRVMGGERYTSAHRYVGLVGVETTLFALSYIQVYYHIAVRRMAAALPLCLAVLAQGLLLLSFHATVEQVLLAMIAVYGCLLIWVSALSWRLVRAPAGQAEGPGAQGEGAPGAAESHLA